MHFEAVTLAAAFDPRVDFVRFSPQLLISMAKGACRARVMMRAAARSSSSPEERMGSSAGRHSSKAIAPPGSTPSVSAPRRVLATRLAILMRSSISIWVEPRSSRWQMCREPGDAGFQAALETLFAHVLKRGQHLVVWRSTTTAKPRRR